MNLIIHCPASGLRVCALECLEAELHDGYCNPVCTPVIAASNKMHAEIMSETWNQDPMYGM